MTARPVFRLLCIQQDTRETRFHSRSHPRGRCFPALQVAWEKGLSMCVRGARGFVGAGRHMAAFCRTNLATGQCPLRMLCRLDPSGSCSWVPWALWPAAADPGHGRAMLSPQSSGLGRCPRRPRPQGRSGAHRSGAGPARPPCCGTGIIFKRNLVGLHFFFQGKFKLA